MHIKHVLIGTCIVVIFFLGMVAVLFKRKGAMPIIITIIMILILLLLGWQYKYGTPGMYALCNEDIEKYSDYIIVKESYSTGTGWVITEGSQEEQINNKSSDVSLTGNTPPTAKIGKNTNEFLCIVEYKGAVEHVAFDEEIDEYEVVEWHPIYPVIRNSLFPDFMLPKEYLSDKEMNHY